MRLASTLLITSIVLTSCGTSDSDVAAFTRAWRERINAEIPIGTNTVSAKVWFQYKLLPIFPNGDRLNGEFLVILGAIPAREWNCEKWDLQVRVKVSPDTQDTKVVGYEFESIGNCLPIKQIRKG